MTRFEALQLAIERLGSQAALARLCGVSTTAVWKWVQSSKQLPPEYVRQVEAETGIPRFVLRDDIYPAEEYRIGYDPGERGGDSFAMVHFRSPARFEGVDQRVSRVSFNTQPLLKGRVA